MSNPLLNKKKNKYLRRFCERKKNDPVWKYEIQEHWESM
jgi:hypothetical protein